MIFQTLMKQRKEPRGRFTAAIRSGDCICCGVCLRYCSLGAIRVTQTPRGSETFSIDTVACNGCGLCVPCCPVDAIALIECARGE
jgi:formate hydrogenlyase subunit 6/NADH:ubiquinone oxidoreductase subunit I